jgi:hypothetical protein
MSHPSKFIAEFCRADNSIVLLDGARPVRLSCDDPDFYFTGPLPELEDLIEQALHTDPSPFAGQEKNTPYPGGVRIFRRTDTDWLYEIHYTESSARVGSIFVLDCEYIKNHEAYPHVRAGNLAHFVIRELFPEVPYPSYKAPLPPPQ